jgi:hypothetical protein
VLVVDAANVIGSRPDGWWRDRPGAAARLVARLRAAAADGRIPTPTVVVLEGAARRGAPVGSAGGVEVVHAPAGGDDTIVERAASGAADAAGAPVVVVTADRGLAGRVLAGGAEVVGPGWLLERLHDPAG